MELRELNKEMQVYYSAYDRFVKKINDNIFEVYHINVVENDNLLVIFTINFIELTNEKINQYLDTCGLVYLPEKNEIVQQFDKNQVVIKDINLIKYVLADRLAICGGHANMDKFVFEDAKDLNQVLLEHDIPHRFSNADLQSI